MSRICIVGSGMMGSALAVPLADRGHDVRLVGSPLDGEIVSRLKVDRVHAKLKERLPDGVRPYDVTELAEAIDGAEVIAFGVSSAGVRWAAGAIAPFLRKGVPILMITKGLEWDGTAVRLLPDVVSELLAPVAPVQPVAVAGPCIAGELARRVETCVLFTGRDSSIASSLAGLSSTPYYNVRVTEDVVGAEVCAALKNAYAMGIAFASGLHERRGGAPGSVAMHNYESAVFAQSVVEMQHVVSVLGGSPATAAGLAGVGDLDVTCNGGRTGRFGRLLGSGLSLDEAVSRMEGATLECLDVLRVLRAALPALDRAGTKLPLLRHLMAVALDGAGVDMPFDRFFAS